MLFQIITSKCRHAIFALFIVVNYVKSIRYRGQVFTSNIIQNDHIFMYVFDVKMYSIVYCNIIPHNN